MGEGHSAEHTGPVTKLGFRDLYLVKRGDDALSELLSYAVKKLGTLHHTATEYKAGRIKNVRKRHEPLNDLVKPAINGASELWSVGNPIEELGGVIQIGQDLSRAAQERGGRRVFLVAAAMTATATDATGVGNEMSKLAGDAASAGKEAAVTYYSTADAGAVGEAEEVAVFPAGTVNGLAKCGGVSVVEDVGGKRKRLADYTSDR